MSDKKKNNGGTELERFVAEADGSEHAVAINDYIYLSKDMGDSYMVATDAGNMVINTGFPGTGKIHKARFAAVSDAPLHYIVLTQCHANQFGGAMDMKDAGTQIIAQDRYPECREYWRILHDFYAKRSNKLWGSVLGKRGDIKNQIVEAELDITFADTYRFDLGDKPIELHATPGGESRDSLVVYLPEDGILFTGNLFGPIFGHLPNLYTIRGDKIRSATEFIRSLELVRSLRPKMLLTGHGKPIEGAGNIDQQLAKLSAAVQSIHDQTVDGMNAGQTVEELMRDVSLSAELQCGEGHGKVAWCVRAVWEEYAGWFHYKSTADLYASSTMDVATDIAELAGGANALAARAQQHIEQGDALAGVRLTDIALAAEAGNTQALQAKLAAHELLLEAAVENFSERRWLQSEIDATRLALDSGTRSND